ncbi:hypothetical protein P7K49_012046 [Saguinus oedipus]|uniref:Protein kinase domain-containing protein n=1 Tax=Saguinus oedipus TaxID=9490 RepID=A0ABQ9VTX8_SAGOE|nr:hypothetical protein P7K49_012046 [Saguinus oedipus]
MGHPAGRARVGGKRVRPGSWVGGGGVATSDYVPQVFLGEVNSGVSSTQVVVKELQASASVQEQMQFLEEAQPYRWEASWQKGPRSPTVPSPDPSLRSHLPLPLPFPLPSQGSPVHSHRALKHSNLLQCLAQCAEVTPYLLVMEFCPLGDLKGYLRSCRVAESMAPDPLTLQRMACEVTCGILHLHRNNYVHSDLALRNCLLTADLTVKIGDYGLAHCKYREDYFVTADQLWVPLRWIAPELVDEVHSNLLVVDQTKSGNGGKAECHPPTCIKPWPQGVRSWGLLEPPVVATHQWSKWLVGLVQPLEWGSSCSGSGLPGVGTIPTLAYLCCFPRFQASVWPPSAPGELSEFGPTGQAPSLSHLTMPHHDTAPPPILTSPQSCPFLACPLLGSRHRALAKATVWALPCPFSGFTPALQLPHRVVSGLQVPAVPGPGSQLSPRRSLGVTIWELFELGAQPYPQHSDQQVLAYAVREQQLKLPKPQLQLTLSDRWHWELEEPHSCPCNAFPVSATYDAAPVGPPRRYEVMQFCWLQPEQRPTAEEVHLLLSYLCAKGATEAEEEFERRWRALRPRGGSVGPGPGAAGPTLAGAVELAAASSFPLLEQFAGDGFHADGDDVLTVTETSRGLNFEYKWEAGRGAEAFPAMPSPGHATRLQELCTPDPDGEPPGVVRVLSAHSPSLGSEYFIRLEEAAPAASHDPDCTGCAPGARTPVDQDDSDGSAATLLAMEPLLDPGPPADIPWGRGDHYPRRSLARDPPCPSGSPSPSAGPRRLAEGRAEDADWGVAAFCPPFFEDPLGTSPLGSSVAPPLPLPSEEEPEEVGAHTATQRGHWRSNVSANNNSSSSHCPESWDLGSAGCYADGCPSPKQTPRVSPEPADPGEPLRGLQAASSAQEPGCCPSLPHLCPAQGLAPAPSLATTSWTEAAGSGGDQPQAEPKLATDAEGTAGPRLPLPSVPSPSQEGAPLPSEEASAPDALPDSPRPAAGGEVSVTELTSALNGGNNSPEAEAPSREDDNTADATLGVFTDTSSDGPQAERPDAVPAFRSLQKQVGTPDSLDSLDITSSASDGGYEVFSPSAAGPPGGQPRALDSGYDTENYESPEFVLKEAQDPCEPQAFGELASESEGPGPETRLSASLSGLSEKNPYRDSAYFSDLEAEATSSPEDKCSGDQAPEPDLGLPSAGQPSMQVSLGLGVPREAQGSGPGESLPSPLRLEGSFPEPSICTSGLGPEPLEPQDPVDVPPGPSPSCSQFFLLTPVLLSSEGDSSQLQGAPGLLSGPAPQKRMGGPSAPRAPLRLALPALPVALEGRPEEEEDSEDSDESDEELRCYSVQEPSEDSEEEAPAVPVVVAESQSARNLRSLLKMPSLLSEDFCEDLDRKKKAVSFFDDVTVYLFDQESPTRELGEPFPGAKESPPTFLMGSLGSPGATGPQQQADDSSPQGSAAGEGAPVPRCTGARAIVEVGWTRDVMEGGSSPCSVGGGGFTWDDDFPLMSAKAAFATALDPAAPAPATPAPFSRFTVSPAPASRFSITHVSDSDAESMKGCSGGPRARQGTELRGRVASVWVPGRGSSFPARDLAWTPPVPQVPAFSLPAGPWVPVPALLPDPIPQICRSPSHQNLPSQKPRQTEPSPTQQVESCWRPEPPLLATPLHCLLQPQDGSSLSGVPTGAAPAHMPDA